MLELIIGVAVVTVNGGALLSFWVYARGKLDVATAQIADLHARVAALENEATTRRQELREDLRVIHGKVTEVHERIDDGLKETTKWREGVSHSLGCIEAKLGGRRQVDAGQ